MLYRLFLWIFLGLTLVACSPNIREGVEAYQAEQYEKALDIFQKYPNDREANYHLYLMANEGKGVPQNRQQAIEWLKQSASKGHPRAMATLGRRKLHGEGINKNQDEGLILLRKAIEAGDLEANADIGSFLIKEGNSIQLGLAHLHKAESTWRGKFDLAFFYGYGFEKVQINPEKAYNYYKEVLLLKNVPQGVVNHTRFNLAQFYYYGFGTLQNFEAAALTLKPATDGHKDAKNFYAWLLYRGEGLPEDKSQAVRMWLENSESIDLYGYSTNGLALAYASGEGVTQDKKKAIESINKTTGSFAGGYWQAIIKAKLTAEFDCQHISSNYLDHTDTNARYRSIAAIAFIEDARCVFEKAKKGRRNQSDLDLYNVKHNLITARKFGAPAAAELQRDINVWQANGGVIIGMTKKQVLASKWGRPRDINRTINASDSTEQWVYESGSYLYFRNDLLETIKN